MDTSRIYNKWPLAREGFPFIGMGCALTLLFSYLGCLSLSVPAGLLSLFITFFFRDPDRKNGAQHKAVLSPADGKVLRIQRLEGTENALGEPAIKISIFMSVFNVHVNRIPVRGVIEMVSYRPGRFFPANLDKASEYNERNKIILRTDNSQKIVFIQIAGLIARRIACWVGEGDLVEAGQRFGLIRFGSRLEVYLPAICHVTATQGQKVRAGETVLGYLP